MTPKSYGKQAKRGLFWGVAREGARSAIIIPTAMVLARLLSPEESGIAAAAMFVVQLAGRLTQFGLGVSLVRAAAITPNHISSVFSINLLMAGLASVTFIAVGPHLGGLLGSTEAAAILPVAGLGFLIGAFGSVPTALLTREMRYRESATSEGLATAVMSISSVLLAWLGFSYWSIIYSTLLGDSARVVQRMWLTKWVPRLAVSREAVNDVMSFGLGVYARNLLEYCSQNIDNLIVGRLLGMTALGHYDKAFATMTKLTAKVNLAGPSISFRAFALIHEDQERFRRAYRKVILSVTVVGYPIMTGMAVVANELIEVMFGSRWRPAAQPFRILCFVAMLRLLNTYASTATQAMGRIWSEVRRQALSVVVLTLSVTLLSHWGINGAAAGVLVSTLVSAVLLQRLVRRLTSFQWHDLLEPQVPGVACSVALALLLIILKYMLNGVYPETPALGVLTISAAVGICWVAVFLVLSPFDEVRMVVRETTEDVGLRWLARYLPAPPVVGPRA